MAPGCLLTHSFVEKQRVPRQMVRAEQAAQDADGALKQINVHILVEGKLCRNPLLSFFKFYRRKKKKRLLSLHSKNNFTWLTKNKLSFMSFTF